MPTKLPGKRSSGKPSKPYPDFPLTAHPNGQWSKKIRGKVYYFGSWSDTDAALKKYLDQRDDLQAGKTPRVTGDGLTIRDLVNRFLSAKKQLLDNGELTARTFADYYATCERLISVFGKTRLVDDLASDDFEKLRANIADTRGAVSLGNEIQRTRVAFKYAYDAGLIDKPVRYGPQFKKPSKKVLRKERAGKGSRMLEPAELRKLIDRASGQLKAMLLLALNCGFGNHDCGTIPLEAIDLAAGVIDYARPKTGIPRRCPLWAETVKALQESIAGLPTPKDEQDTGLAFITKYGKPWAKQGDVYADKESGGFEVRSGSANPISAEFRKLLKAAELYRKGLGFYSLRHVFRTIADETRDFPAIDHIMGHARDDMASVYRERIGDDRLRAVVNHVHGWLFSDASGAVKPEPVEVADDRPFRVVG